MAFSGSDPVVFEVETLLNPLLKLLFTDVDDHGVTVLNTAKHYLTITGIDEGIFGLIIFIVRMCLKKKKKVLHFLYVYM